MMNFVNVCTILKVKTLCLVENITSWKFPDQYKQIASSDVKNTLKIPKGKFSIKINLTEKYPTMTHRTWYFMHDNSS